MRKPKKRVPFPIGWSTHTRANSDPGPLVWERVGTLTVPTAVKVGVKNRVGRARPPEEKWQQLWPSQAEKLGGGPPNETKQDAPGPSPGCAADEYGAAGIAAGEEAAWSLPQRRGFGGGSGGKDW